MRALKRPWFALAGHGFVGLLVVTVVVASFAAPAAATESTGPNIPVGSNTETIVVELTADGDARVTLVTPFDLETDAEREAFVRLRTNDSATARLLESYRTRMTAVAERAADRTGREMAITGGDFGLTARSEESNGYVHLSVTWTDLATTTDERVELGVPFDSGFTADARFVVVVPEGHELETVTPRPSTTRDRVAVWSPGADLSGFSLVSRPTDESRGATETADDSAVSPGGQPGFGLVIPTIALLTLVVVARRRL